MIHKHHIIPRHAGGDPNGPTVELTTEEHAEEHRLLWLKEGREYDRIAWLALSGQIGKEEALLLALKSPERRKKISDRLKGQPKKWWKGGHHSEETKKKIGISNRKPKPKVSLALKDKPKPWLKGRPAWNKGKTHSPESKRKIAEATKLRWENGWQGRWEQ